MDVARFAYVVPPLLLAVIFHEVMHGYVAYRLGDPTAKEQGRLTLNPLAHVDPLGTVVIPLLLIVSGAKFLFGYAKPVPVNIFRLRRPKQDMVRVAAAGPISNLALAAVSGILFRVLHWAFPPAGGGVSFSGFFLGMAEVSVYINVLLAVFNLLPIPPLDGGRIMVGLLPRPQAVALSRVEPFGMFLIVGLIMLNPFGIMGMVWRLIDLLALAMIGFGVAR